MTSTSSPLRIAATRPYGKACVICRRMKIKCINTGMESNRCDRCIKLNKDCQAEPHRRRLHRHDEKVDRRSPASSQAPSSSSGSSVTRSSQSPARFEQDSSSQITLHDWELPPHGNEQDIVEIQLPDAAISTGDSYTQNGSTMLYPDKGYLNANPSNYYSPFWHCTPGQGSTQTLSDPGLELMRSTTSFQTQSSIGMAYDTGLVDVYLGQQSAYASATGLAYDTHIPFDFFSTDPRQT